MSDLISKSLPKEIALAYTVKKLITIHKHNAVFSILSKASRKPYVLKILDKDYFDKRLYQKISAPPVSYLLLPKLQISDRDFIYLVYSQLVPLSEAVSTNHLTYPMLRTLLADIGQAILSLHEREILHLDITPNNIFLGKDGHFYLGDFSSARFIGKFRFYHHSMRTATTPAFAPPGSIQQASYSYWNDCYSFTFLLFYLFHDGQLPDEVKKLEKTLSPFSALEPHFHRMLYEPPKACKNMMKEFLSDLEDTLSLCDKDDACQNYCLQIRHSEQHSFFEATIHMEPEEEKTALSLLPRYGCLLLCGLLFLFTLYQHLAKNRYSTEKSAGFTVEAQAPTPQAAVLKTPAPLQTVAPLTPSPTVLLNTVTESPSPSLKILFANHQKLTSCSSFAEHTELKELYLHDNKITSLQDFPKLTHLEVLVLSKNQITNVSPLARLPALTTLDLSHNDSLTHIHSLAELKTLQTLILTNTNITKKEILSLEKKLPHCTIYY